MTPVGLPHSEIPGSKRACRSPRHIAACHVFHRLSVPRHPPSTLSNLTIKCLDLMRSAVPRPACSWQSTVGRSSSLLSTAYRALRTDASCISIYLPIFNCQRFAAVAKTNAERNRQDCAHRLSRGCLAHLAAVTRMTRKRQADSAQPWSSAKEWWS